MAPMDQGNGDADSMLAQRIRKALTEDSTLAPTARNVKIVSRGGNVTLRGLVRSQAERKAIEVMARKEPGVNSVDNLLQVTEE